MECTASQVWTFREVHGSSTKHYASLSTEKEKKRVLMKAEVDEIRGLLSG